MMKNSNRYIDSIIGPFNNFIKAEASGGIFLLAATAAALIWANSSAAEYYFKLWHTHVSLSFGNSSLDYSLHHWINDGLMAVFFFVVGLEIKREFLVGELSSLKKTALPVAAALGGMIFPALIYLFFNSSGAGIGGWGIPMATDIAFAIGILALLGSRIPISLKIFVTALAIADDIGAVLVIAFFYTSQISIYALSSAAGFMLLLIIANKTGVRNLLIYTLLGIGLWISMIFSGIHATIAGVLLALTVPASSRIEPDKFVESSKTLLKSFDESGEAGKDVLKNEARLSYVQKLEENCEMVMTPLQKFEHALTPWVSFFIMPIFALANAGVKLDDNFLQRFTEPVSIGIITGLFFGKQAGILLFSWISVKIKLAVKPADIRWTQIYGAGILAGVGFTMSLFISNLAFTDELLNEAAKVGILSASIISAVAGTLLLLYFGKNAMPGKSKE